MSNSAVKFNLTTTCNLAKVGDDFILCVASQVADMYEIEDKGQLTFKFKSGEILTVYSTASQCANYTSYWINNILVEKYELTPLYNLSTTDLSSLQTNDIVKVRICVKSGMIDFDIKPNIAKNYV